MLEFEVKKLEELGVERERTLNRFMGNEKLYLEFLRKFPVDKSYEGLHKNILHKNFENAFKCAHTLKGVVANLGLGHLMQPVYALTELLRQPPYRETSILKEMKRVEKHYNKVLKIINEWEIWNG